MLSATALAKGQKLIAKAVFINFLDNSWKSRLLSVQHARQPIYFRVYLPLPLYG